MRLSPSPEVPTALRFFAKGGEPGWCGDDRPVPREWQARLRELFPATEQTTHLHLRWEKGNPWEPINRWMIWHMYPVHAIADDLRKELLGPPPRATGHYCADGWCLCDRKMDSWTDGAAFQIDQQQWELYRETGYYGQRWWVIQGDKGGHKYRLNQIEAKVAKLHTGKSSTPAAGDLPYADFDDRVIAKIVERDRARMYATVARWGEDVTVRGRMLDEEDRAGVLEANQLLWDWLESQVGAATQTLSHWDRFAISQQMPTGLDKEFLKRQREREEAHKQAFLNEGVA